MCTSPSQLCRRPFRSPREPPEHGLPILRQEGACMPGGWSRGKARSCPLTPSEVSMPQTPRPTYLTPEQIQALQAENLRLRAALLSVSADRDQAKRERDWLLLVGGWDHPGSLAHRKAEWDMVQRGPRV